MTSNPKQTLFYTIERAIKEYRKYAQHNILEHINDITLDQALVLTIIDTEPSISQKEIANFLYKDYASLTRIIELMVEKNYVTRQTNKADRRRFNLIITKKGNTALKKILPIIKANRESAILGLSQQEVSQLNTLLNKIIINCKKIKL